MGVQYIESSFAKRGRKIGGILLFRPNDALDFPEECHKAGLRLVGVEGFKLNGKKIQPFQEHSNDIADTNCTTDEFFAETEKFIAERKQFDLWFEVVVTKPDS